MKKILFFGAVLLIISCSKKSTCNCSGTIGAEQINYSEEFKTSAEAQDACNVQQSKYDNSNADFKSLSCTVN